MSTYLNCIGNLMAIFRMSPQNTSNPENRAVFDSIIEQAMRTDADICLATDPDCDRMGAAARLIPGGDQWETLTGNQLCALLCDYVGTQTKGSRDGRRKCICHHNIGNYFTDGSGCRILWSSMFRQKPGWFQMDRRIDRQKRSVPIFCLVQKNLTAISLANTRATKMVQWRAC